MVSRLVGASVDEAGSLVSEVIVAGKSASRLGVSYALVILIAYIACDMLFWPYLLNSRYWPSGKFPPFYRSKIPPSNKLSLRRLFVIEKLAPSFPKMI